MKYILSLFNFGHYFRKQYYRNKNRKAYYRQFVTEEDTCSLLALMQPSGTFKNTPEPICYNGIAFGSSLGQLRKNFGTPRHFFSISMNTAKHQAVIFVKKINEHRVIINCHFLDGKLFLVHNHLEEPLQDLGGLLKTEMENKYKCSFDERENLIGDENGNRLIFSTHPSINSYMFSGNKIFIEKLQNEMAYQQNRTDIQSRRCYSQIARSLA